MRALRFSLVQPLRPIAPSSAWAMTASRGPAYSKNLRNASQK